MLWPLCCSEVSPETSLLLLYCLLLHQEHCAGLLLFTMLPVLIGLLTCVWNFCSKFHFPITFGVWTHAKSTSSWQCQNAFLSERRKKKNQSSDSHAPVGHPRDFLSWKKTVLESFCHKFPFPCIWARGRCSLDFIDSLEAFSFHFVLIQNIGLHF